MRIFLLIVFLFASHEAIWAAESFSEGETLTYEAHWGPFIAADLIMETVKTNQPQTHWIFHGTCHSRGVPEAIYPIRSTVTSASLLDLTQSLYFFEKRKEGTRRYHRLMTFDFKNKNGMWTNYISGDGKRLKLDKPPLDIFSTLYYVRSLSWDAGQSRKIQIYADGKYHELDFKAQKRMQKKVHEWKEQPTIEIVSDSIFEKATKRKGRLTAIVTDDTRHIPLQARLEVSWGTVRLDLVDAKGILGSPLEKEEKQD